MSWRASVAYVCALLIGFLIATVGTFWESIELAARAYSYGETLDSPALATTRSMVALALGVSLVLGAVAAPVFAVLILLVRRFRLQRPFADICIGLVFGAVAAIPLAQFAHSDVIGCAVFLFAGLAGGVLYWLVAGTPRP